MLLLEFPVSPCSLENESGFGKFLCPWEETEQSESMQDFL